MRELTRIIAGGASALLVLAVMPTLAQAGTYPPCDTGATNSEFKLKVPTEIAIGGIGAEATVEDVLCEISPTYPWAWAYPFDTGVTYSAADPTLPISHPFSRTIDQYDFDDGYGEVTIELPAFESGDGPAVLTLTWTQANIYSQTYQTRARSMTSPQINPTRGHPPNGVRADGDLHTVQKRVHGIKQPDWYTVWDEFIRFEVRPYKPESLGTVEPIKITIRGGGRLTTGRSAANTTTKSLSFTRVGFTASAASHSRPPPPGRS